MSLTDILAFLKGSVSIEAEGLFLERFLNICMRRGIFLSDVLREGPEKISAKIGIGGFRTIRPIAKKTKTRIRIRSRDGMPFLIHRYKKRRIAIVGVLLFLGILWYLSGHIIGIDIVGNSRLSTLKIEQELKGFGLYRGTPTSKIDRQHLQNQMMTKLDELAWIGINIKGSRAYIEVKERLDTKLSEDEDIPCNIIAARSGQIKGLEIKSGQTVVKINDMVEKGDLLVSGAMDSAVEGIRYAHSSGNVYAETIYKKSRVYPLEYQKKLYTGKKTIRRSVNMFGQNVRLYLRDNMPYEYFEKESRTLRHHLWGVDNIFVDITETAYREYTPQKKTRSAKQAVDLGGKELTEEIQKEFAGRVEILNKQITFCQTDKKSIEVTVEVLCREDIAQQSVIDKIENMDYNVD